MRTFFAVILLVCATAAPLFPVLVGAADIYEVVEFTIGTVFSFYALTLRVDF